MHQLYLWVHTQANASTGLGTKDDCIEQAGHALLRLMDRKRSVKSAGHCAQSGVAPAIEVNLVRVHWRESV